MKDGIILFIIGVLVGAVISTGAFYVYTTTNGSCNSNSMNTQMSGGTPPDMSSGQPPEKPNGNNSENSNQ